MSAWDWMTGVTGGRVGRWTSARNIAWTDGLRTKQSAGKKAAKRHKALRLKSVDELLEEQRNAARRY